MIEKALLELDSLRDRKNLLAFSAGVDSTALLFILQKIDIRCDLVLVNYRTREESNLEESYAKDLSERLGLNCFTTKAPKFKKDFENRAREFRYNFFENIISEYQYHNLLTAHHLGDRLEWFIMQLIKGSGVVELLGMEAKSYRTTSKGVKYSLVRPLLNTSKDELLEFLKRENIKYFVDSSNSNKNIFRNRIRENFASKLIREYRYGIEKSFDYLKRDRDFINGCFKLKKEIKKLAVFELKDIFCTDRATDSYLKKYGVVMSSKERKVLLERGSTQISRGWIAQRDGNLLFIAPFVESVKIPKRERERYRLAKVPHRIRGYLYIEKIKLEEIF
jgi:tRNA(Ile)-lysidine synthase